MSKYKVEFAKKALKELKKFDKYTQKILISWIEKYLVNCINPFEHGKRLTGDKHGLWRYRIGDYRLICTIDSEKFVILAISVGHRREIYRN